MRSFFDAIRSVFFNIFFYAFTVLFASFYILPAGLLFGRNGIRHGLHIYCGTNRFVARWLMGVRYEYRGTEQLPPIGEGFILAAAHQSTLDPVLTFMVRPDLTALAKKELMDLPVIGNILNILGVIRVDRQKGDAHKDMERVGRLVRDDGLMLIVYPQATRITPGSRKKLKAGAYHLARDTGLDVYTVATDTGLYWSNGFFHRSGLATFEVVRKLDPAVGKDAFMRALEEDIVLRSEALAVEKGKADLLRLPDSAQPAARLTAD